MTGIKLENVSKSYGNTEVIHEMDLEINAGERVVFLGPSGCGKSTTLRMIAGLESITSGKLYLDGEDVTNLESGKRDIAMVFQNYALYPNMTVKDNITFALKANKVEKKEIERRLQKALEMLDLTQYQDRLPKDLSGGQRQRVALARAIVKRSKYFLLDEPLSNLDVTLRQSARNQLIDIHDEYHQTYIYVTHDQEEAMTLGHRIVLMNKGKIQMVGTPEEVYNQPKNVFTASFIGTPKMNLQPVSWRDNHLLIGSQELELNSEWLQYLNDFSEKDYIIGIRPEHISISKEPSENSIHAVVKMTENLGPNYAVNVETKSTEWVVISSIRDWEKGDSAHIHFDVNKIHLFNKTTEENIGYPNK